MLSTNVSSNFIFAANIRLRVVRSVLTLAVNFLLVTEVDPAIVTLGVAAGAMVAACSRIHHTSAAFLGRRIVGQFAAEWVDASLVTEEEARIVRVETTTLGVASTDTSDNVSFTAFKVKVWRNKRIS